MKPTFASACLLMAALLMSFPSTTSAQDQLEREAGYVQFEQLDRLFPSLPKLEVNVKGPLLRLVVEASRHEDEALADVLSRLMAVQVRTYEMPSDGKTSIESYTDRLSRDLAGSGWETVVRVRDQDDRVDMFLRERRGAIAGLVVMVLDGTEATFVNIVGEIDPAEIGRIGRKFNIDPLRNGIGEMR